MVKNEKLHGRELLFIELLFNWLVSYTSVFVLITKQILRKIIK